MIFVFFAPKISRLSVGYPSRRKISVIISMVFIFSHPLTLLIYSKPETNLNQMGRHESWTFKINLLHI